jgi:enoyl-CoA hydratase/carnithine racemase
MDEITHAARSFQDDVETRAVVFRGRGKHFCSGADLVEAAESSEEPATRLATRRQLRRGPEMIGAIHQMNQITVCAMKGVSLGGGACIATACDFRVADTGAVAGYPEVKLGMNLSWIALPLCVHLVGPSVAKRLIALGNKESAEDLLRWGFVDEVVDPDELESRAFEIAREFADRPPIAAQMIKQSVNALVSALDQSVMHMDRDQWAWTATTDDFREGIRSFLEKRPPEFKGD